MNTLKKAIIGIGKKENNKKPPVLTEGTAIQIPVQQGPVTNLYSKNADFSIDALNQLLSNLSVGDTKHDFGYTNEALKNKKFKDSFNTGIEVPYSDNILSEPECLNSVIKSYSTDGGARDIETEYTPIQVANPEYKYGETSEHNITTVNGNKYQVNYTDVKVPPVEQKGIVQKASSMLVNVIKGSPVINARTFYENLKLDPNEKIAIIVDAASISLYDILNTGTFRTTRPTVYYVYAEEIVNDPATKKSPDAKEFSKETGVKFIPCVPIETNKNLYYNYSYENPTENTPFIKQFYTNYQFQLSELKKSVKGRSSEYITNLNIVGREQGHFNSLPDSKSKNDITFLTSFLKKFLDKIFGNGTITAEQHFLFSSALQQKRSGDWLQVLLCAAIKDHIRNFKRYNDDSNIDDISRVFLVTHDQIALSFALLMGIDCIFTHHNGSKHFHSAFVYKILDPVADNKRKAALAKKIVDELKGPLITKINELIENIKVYQREKYDLITNQKNNLLNDHLRVELNKIDNKTGEYTIKNEDNKYNVSWFNRETRAIFTSALEAMISKNIIPNLNDQIVDLTANKTGIEESLNNDRLSNIDSVIQNYNRYNTQYENIKKIYETSNSVDTKLFNNKISDFKKSNIYKRAAEWTWDINISSREVAFMENDAASTYKSDRNIFLYNINELDDIFKQQITFIYYKYYTFLLDRCTLTTIANLNDVGFFKNGEGQLVDRSYIKFRAVSLSFCTEVLLTLGGMGVNFDKVTLTSHQIVEKMEEFLTKNPETISTLLKDNVIVEEDNNYNNAVQKITADSLEAQVDVTINDAAVSDNVNLPDTIRVDETTINMRGGDIITVGSFMTSIKQVTYPLLALILFNSKYSDRVKETAKQQLSLQKVDIDLHNIPADDSVTQMPLGTSESDNNDIINKNVSDNYAPSFTEITPPMVAPSEKTQVFIAPGAITRNATQEKGGKDKEGQFGGSIQNLRTLFASLPKSSSETPITFYNTTDIFQDNTICFHPLLPIYMITQTYMSAINNEHIEESLDFDLFVNYLNFLKKIKEKVVEIYSGENNNTNLNKLEAYAIGLGLKQLLFVSNNTNDGYRDCLKVLNAEDSIYRPVSSLTDSLCSAICGKITHADIVLQEGPIYLNSDLFTQFARSLNVNRIFGFYVDTSDFNLANFKAQVLEFSNELAQQIIADRTGNGSVPISPASSISPPISDTNVALGLKPFDPTRVKTAKDIGFTYSDGDESNIIKLSSSSGSISPSKGGKKSRKHKEKVKRQTRKHKKQSKNIKRKTRKHKKYAKKTRRSTSV